jgi:hypothetical protein
MYFISILLPNNKLTRKQGNTVFQLAKADPP